MRVLILGATGGVGVEIVRQAVRRGHQVTALVRSATRLKSYEHAIRTLEGDLLKRKHAGECSPESGGRSFRVWTETSHCEERTGSAYAVCIGISSSDAARGCSTPCYRFNGISVQRCSATAGLSSWALILSNCCYVRNSDGEHNCCQ
jgi:NAD(P)-dependent dehydrogenase (short-subunit alcohol dehydrogenase family)